MTSTGGAPAVERPAPRESSSIGPAARPAMAILGLFTFMTAWTDYLWPLLVAPQNPTLQVALSQLQSAKYVDYSVVLSGAVLATLPLLIIFILAGRQLVSGIMAGAVKG